MTPSQGEIEEQASKAWDKVNEGDSDYPGLSYEEGVAAALDWVRGSSDDKPMEDDD